MNYNWPGGSRRGGKRERKKELEEEEIDAWSCVYTDLSSVSKHIFEVFFLQFGYSS